MTEEEKIFAGYIFNNRAPELVAMKHKAHNACLRFNQMDEYDPLRQPIIKEFIGSIGTVYYFQGPVGRRPVDYYILVICKKLFPYALYGPSYTAGGIEADGYY